MSKKAGDILARMKQVAVRERTAGDDPLSGRAEPVHPGADPLRDRPSAVHPGDDPLSGRAEPVHPGADPLRDRPSAVHPGDDPLSGRRAAVHPGADPLSGRAELVQPETPSKRVRITVDLDPSQHRFLKIYAAERGLKGSEVLRALLAELHSDTELQQAIQKRLGK